MAALHTRPLHYLNGHFYHPETGERVLLRDGAELVFTGHKQDFLLTDRAGAPYETSELRDVETMKRTLANDPAVGSFGLLLPTGATLRFRLKPTTSPVPGAKPTDYTFVVRLDEPLFVSRPAVPGTGVGARRRVVLIPLSRKNARPSGLARSKRRSPPRRRSPRGWCPGWSVG